MSTALPLSVVIVAKNAASHLARCLDSVVSWAGELIVVLNDTTDESRAIAESRGARVYDLPWQGFRDTKNAANAFATQPWVLSLDADEALTPELRAEIGKWIQDAPRHGQVAARFPRRTWFLQRWITHGDWYPDHCQRLFAREHARWGGGLVHERLECAGPVGTLKNDLLHYSFASIREAATKALRYGELGAEQHHLAGKSVSLLAIFGRTTWGFFRCFILRRGFLDGGAGLVVAGLVAWAKFAKYSRIYELSLSRKPDV